MLRMHSTVKGSKRYCRSKIFQTLAPGIIRSATQNSGRSVKFTLGLGLKSGIKGIQLELHTSTWAPLEIEIQTHFLTTSLFLSKPFQSQGEVGEEYASKKGSLSLRYLLLRTSTQGAVSLIVSFQPNLANKEWLINSKGRILRPTKALGWQIVSQEKKDRECFLSWEKPHQNFLIIAVIYKQKDLGIKKRDIK
jgi:hypothetical protein